MVKFVACLKRKPGMSAAEFHRYWKDVHGPLVKGVPEFMRHVRKYVQSHAVSDSVAGFPSAPSQYDGTAELWFDSLEECIKAFNEPRYLEIIRKDEPKFLDLAACSIFVAEEVPMHGA
ncbi:MAG: EthD domain-containing protein [Candidatus Binataceae bacterium]|jgi:uncharacterized protein (TIGR02118 family)